MSDFKIGRIEQLTNDARTPEWKELIGNLSISRADAHSQLCQNCQARPATLNWTGEGGTLAFVHGMYQRWCETCVLVAQLAHANQQALLIPKLRERLDALAQADEQARTTNAVDPSAQPSGTPSARAGSSLSSTACGSAEKEPDR